MICLKKVVLQKIKIYSLEVYKYRKLKFTIFYHVKETQYYLIKNLIRETVVFFCLHSMLDIEVRLQYYRINITRWPNFFFMREVICRTRGNAEWKEYAHALCSLKFNKEINQLLLKFWLVWFQWEMKRIFGFRRTETRFFFGCNKRQQLVVHGLHNMV